MVLLWRVALPLAGQQVLTRSNFHCLAAQHAQIANIKGVIIFMLDSYLYSSAAQAPSHTPRPQEFIIQPGRACGTAHNCLYAS